MENLVIPFDRLSIGDVAIVGGKNASLGEMYRELVPLGIQIPDGFATTADAFRLFKKSNQLDQPIKELLGGLDIERGDKLREVSVQIKKLILDSTIPLPLEQEILEAYRKLCVLHGRELDVAVRSSATAEDLPGASFAGQHESFLNIRGDQALMRAVKSCFASLYNARAIKYRHDKGFDKIEIALSVGCLLYTSDAADE